MNRAQTMNRRKMACAIASVVLVVGVGLLIWSFNRGYGTVTHRSYEIATALFSACNRKDAATLDKLEPLLTDAVASNEVTIREARWLQGMINKARSGQWQVACRSCRQLLNDQAQARTLPSLEW
jgi:hypothetical protein